MNNFKERGRGREREREEEGKLSEAATRARFCDGYFRKIIFRRFDEKDLSGTSGYTKQLYARRKKPGAYFHEKVQTRA